MKSLLLAVATVLLPLLPLQLAAEQKGDVKTELRALIDKIKAKLSQGKDSEKDFGDELKQFDTLFAEHSREKTDEVAQILYTKAAIYFEAFNDVDKAAAILKQLKSNFPETATGKQADETLAAYTKVGAAIKIRRSLVSGSPFPAFNEKDLDGKPLSSANYKGRIVLVDFWATWCGPCREEMPNVIKTYQKYHDKGFEIIGVSLDPDKAKLIAFIRENKMRWPEYFDGAGWENKLAAKYGITSIPGNILLDKNGRIIGNDLSGAELDQAVGKALGL